MSFFENAFYLLIAYLLGSIPFGLLLAKWMGKGDLRTQGSGNIGATNAVRVGGKKLGVLVLLFDAGKGAVAVYIAPNLAVYMYLFAVLGHLFPVWLRFRGGKGVATSLGGLLAFYPALAATTAAVWAGLFFWKRISGLSAVVAAATLPFIACVFFESRGDELGVLTLISLLVLVRHKSNIKTLLAQYAAKKTKQ